MENKTYSIGAGAILDSVLSDDEEYIAIASPNGVSLHDTASLSKLFFFETNIPPTKVGISSKNNYIAYATNKGGLSILDIKTKSEFSLKSHKEIKIIDFKDQSIPSFFQAIENKSADTVFDHNTAKSIFQVFTENTISSIAFSPDEKYLATYGHSSILLKSHEISKMSFQDAREFARALPLYSIIIWDIINKTPKNILVSETDITEHIEGLTFSKDSKQLISWGDKKNGPHLWNLENGKLSHSFNHMHPFSDTQNVVFSEDEKHIISEGSGTFTSSNIATGKVEKTYELGPTDIPEWVKYAYDKRTNKQKKLEAAKSKLLEYSLPIKKLVISPDNKFIFSGSDEYRIKIWEISSKKIIKTIDFPSQEPVELEAIMDLKISPNGSILAIAFNNETLLIWDIENEAIIMQAPCNLDVTLEFSSNSKYLYVSDNKKAAWTKTKKKLQVFNLEKTPPSLLWENEDFLETKNDLSENQNQISLSKSEKLIASCTSEGEICVRNAISGELLIKESFKKELSQFQKGLGLSSTQKIQYFYFLPTDDDNLLVKADKDIWVIETKTSTKSNVNTGIDTDFLQLDGIFTISHNANYLACIKDEIVSIWNLITNQKIDQMLTHATKANCIHFSIDETIIISGGEDGLINILDLRATS